MFKTAVSKRADELAKSLAADIAKKYPPGVESGDHRKKISERRITRVLEDAYSRAVQFRKDNKLGFYRKARMGNVFKWELAALGYSERFVKMATEGMGVYLTRK